MGKHCLPHKFGFIRHRGDDGDDNRIDDDNEGNIGDNDETVDDRNDCHATQHVKVTHLTWHESTKSSQHFARIGLTSVRLLVRLRISGRLWLKLLHLHENVSI